MRPSILGNPFIIGQDGTREEVIAKFRKYFERRIHNDLVFLQAVVELKGKKLVVAVHQNLVTEIFILNFWNEKEDEFETYNYNRFPAKK